MSRPAICFGCKGKSTLAATHCTDDGLPLCADCAHVRRERGIDGPGRDAAPIVNNVSGVDQDGKVPDGAAAWEWRPPRAAPDAHHTAEVILNGSRCYQQAPPIHVPGAPAKASSGRGAASGTTPAAERADAVRDAVALLSDEGPLTERDRRVLELYAELPKAGRITAIATAIGATETPTERVIGRAKDRARRWASRAPRTTTENELTIRP